MYIEYYRSSYMRYIYYRLSDVCQLLYSGVSSSIANDYYNKTDNIFLHPQDIARYITTKQLLLILILYSEYTLIWSILLLMVM